MDSSWATDPQQSFTGLNNGSEILTSTNVSSDSNQTVSNSSPIQNETGQNNILISGNVIKCDSGAPFPQVNVKLSDLLGNEIATTRTDLNGNYNFNFSGSSSSYMLTASYPGHVTQSKILQLSSNGAMLIGTANFQLGPEPVVTINAPAEQFLNETFNFSLNFDNVGNETGFGPIVQLILPPQIQFNSASFLGGSVSTTFVGIFNSSGILYDPISKLNVTGTNGSSLYIFEYPLGSYTKGQPIATININALLLGNSTLGTPLNITAYPVFRFGANETGTTPIRGNGTTAWVTPTVIKLNKDSDAPEDETATGYNYSHKYYLYVDIANGQTISPVNVIDILPSNLQFIRFNDTAGGTINSTPSTSTPGGRIWIQFPSITGVTGIDRTIIYEAYAPKFDNNTPIPNHVLDPNTGLPTNATNLANASGTFRSQNVSSAANYTLTLRSLAIQKYREVIGTYPSPKPTDLIKYTLDFQVSDYFKLNNLVIRDTLGDGQSFLNSTGYIPFLTLHLPTGFVNLTFNLTDPNQFQFVYNNTTGISYLTFNVTRLLIDNNETGVLEGGNYTGTDYGATRGIITFWSQIDIYYQNKSLVPTPKPIVSNDVISNAVTTDANLFNSTNVVTDGSSSSVTIVAPTSSKTIYKINGQDPVGPPYVIRPGDLVTFSLYVTVPTTNLYNFYLMDYLPIPIFRASEFVNATPYPISPTDIPPPAGRWQLANDSTLSELTGQLPWLINDTAQNTLKFCYANVTNSTQPLSVSHIYFTVTATGDPMANGLWLTNWLNINWENTPGTPFQENKIISILIGEPQLTITKNATPTTNLQAGDVVTYTLTVKNTGNAPAYNVVVADDLFTANAGYLILNSIAARYGNGTAITGLTLSDLFTPTGLNFTAVYPLGFNNTNNTIIIEYNVTLNSTVYPRQVINNTAQITKFTSLPAADSPNFVKDPTQYQAKASVQVRDVVFGKTYDGSINNISPLANLAIGEQGLFRINVTLPAGTIHDLYIRDVLPAGLVYVSHAIDNSTYSGSLGTLVFTQTGNTLNFTFTGVTNTTNNSTFYINLTVRMDNATNALYPGNRARVNNAYLDWSDPGNPTTPINRQATVNLIEPQQVVTKQFLPTNTVLADQTLTVRITVSNTGPQARSTAYNVTISDSLSWANTIFDLNSVVPVTTPSGFTFNYNNTTNIVTYTGGNITNGASRTFEFNITALHLPVLGLNLTNTANATYWSLPQNGTFPDSRKYNNSGSASIQSGIVTLEKKVYDSAIKPVDGTLTIGEWVNFALKTSMPQGLATNVRVIDYLPPGFSYNGYTIDKSSFSGILPSESVTISGSTLTGQIITFLFSGTTNSTMPNNNFTIYINATVLNFTSNQNGTVKTNNMTFTCDEHTGPPCTAYVDTKIVEPKLDVVKSASAYTVDAGDVVTIYLVVNNVGTSPAYQIKITDSLNSTLFDNSTFVPYTDPNYSITISDYLVTIQPFDPTTFLANGTNQTFRFNVTVKGDVPSNSSFINFVNFFYSSMPPGYNETRNYTNSSTPINFTTPTPSIAKSVIDHSEPVTALPNVLIGEVVTYRLTLTIPEGKTLNAAIQDVLPINLGFNSGTGRIIRSNNSISSTGFNFNESAGVPQFLNDTYFAGNALNINFGNITYVGIDGLHNGNITILFNATVLNIANNTNGTQISNNATFNFTNASGNIRNLTAFASSLNVTLPHLFVVKTSDRSSSPIQGGDIVTYTLNVGNDAFSNGAPAFDIVVTDYLPAGLIFSSISSLPSGWTYDASNTSKIIFTSPAGFNLTAGNSTLGHNITIVFSAVALQNITYNSTFNNTANATGTTLPGPHGTNNATPGDPGTSTGERTGDPTQPAGAVNNIFATGWVTITSRSPTVSKGTNRTTASIGETATQTITIVLPEGYTPNLTIVDNLLGGLDYISGSLVVNLPGGTTSGNPTTEASPFFTKIGQNITFNFGWINSTSGGNITINYNVMVNKNSSNVNGTLLTNNATLTFINGQGGTSTSGPANSTIRVVEPLLQITKTADKTPANYNPGDNVIFTINVSHRSGSTSDAYNLVIRDTIPAGLTYQSTLPLPSGWLVDESQAGLNIITFYTNSSTSLPLGQSALINFICKVGNYTWAGQNLTNNASLNYTSTFNQTNARSYGPVNTNATIHIIGADIFVIKTTTTPTVFAGQAQQFNYSLKIGNNGPDAAVNVNLNDLIDPSWYGWLYNVQYWFNGTWSSFTNPLNIILATSLSQGTNITINITGFVNSSAPVGTINNTATVNSTTTDPNPSNNTSTALINVLQQANISIIKTGPATVLAGNQITYNINVSNSGPSDARDVEVRDNLPAVLTTVSYSTNGGADWINWPPSLGYIDLGTITSGSNKTILIRGLVPSNTTNGTSLLNIVNATTSTNGTNFTSSNWTTTVNTSALMNISKSGVPPTVLAGEDITYNIVVTNYGPSDALNVRLYDNVVPAYLSNIKYFIIGESTDWITLGAYIDLNTIIYNQFKTIQIRGTVSPSTPNGTQLNNSASITSNTTPLSGNLTANCTNNVTTLANLTITKSGIPNPVIAGQNLVYTIIITNQGPSDAQNVILSDNVTAFLSNVTYTTSPNHGNGTWTGSANFGTLGAGQSITVTLNGTVLPNITGTITNIAYVTSPTDPNAQPGNPKNATVTNNVNTYAEIQLTKSNNPPDIVIAGNNLLYTLTLTNPGPSVARDVMLYDNTLSSYYLSRFYRFSINGGAWSTWTGFSGPLVLNVTNSTNFPAGYMGVGENFTVQINGTINASTPIGTVINNTANVTSSTSPFNITSNTVTNYVQTLANLEISKTVDQPVVVAGTAIQYTVTVKNNGPSDAQNVIVTDALPYYVKGLYYSTNGGSSWISWPSNGIINLTTMAFNQTVTILINGTVNATTPNGTLLNNTVNVTSPTDPNPHEAWASSTVNTVANLTIDKENNPSNIVYAGNSLLYTITITNPGPSVARDVMFYDNTLSSWLLNPREYRYSINGGAWSGWTGFNGNLNIDVTALFPAGYMNVGENFTVQINSTVNASTPNGTVINNTANVTSSTSPFNNSDQVSNEVRTLANLEINKAVTETPVVIAGTAIHYTINVRNNGPSDAQDVRVYDTLPTYVTGLWYSFNGGSWLAWPPVGGYIGLGTMAVNQTIQILINGTVSPSAPNGTLLNNTVNVTSPTDPAVHNASAATTVNALADLSINKTVTEYPLVNAGTPIHYTVTVKNNGPSDAQNVIVTDALPNYVTGLFYSINGGSSWISWPPTGIINLTTMAFNQTIIILINGTVSSSAPNGTLLNNTVNVTSPTDPVVHNASAATTVNTTAILTINKVADVDKIIRGYPIHYTITITNTGPSDALNVNFYDDFTPNMLQNTYYSTSTGIPWTAFTAPLNITNIVPVLAPGANITIWINGTVATNATGNLTNNATTNSQTDPAGNKTSSVTTPMQTANLIIQKTVNNPLPTVGQTIYYTITVTNTGPDTAVDVYVVDKLPDAATYVSSTANIGSYNPNTGIWTIGNLTKGTVAQLIITVIVNKVGVLQNTAYVNSASDNPSSGGGNSSSTVSVVVLQRNLRMEQLECRKQECPYHR